MTAYFSPIGRTRVDLFAVGAALLAVVMLVVYLAILRQQDGEPALWAIAALVLGAVGAGYGSVKNAQHRRAALVAAGLVLLALGGLAILTIGLPILMAGGLCLVAAVRA